jgi:putative transposase
MRLLAYGVRPHHGHLVVGPRADGARSRVVGRRTLTHTPRWHAHHHTAGTGPLHQGRFKSFQFQEDEHLLTVLRYVERNALRAGLAGWAEAWRWSSLWHRAKGSAARLLDDGPVPPPEGWADVVQQPQTEAELAALRRSVVRGTPFGETGWRQQTAAVLGLESTLRPVGRPRKARPLPGQNRLTARMALN